MGTTQIIGKDVTRPDVSPLTSSVLDHATVKTYGENEGFGMANNAGLWPSYNCLDTLFTTQWCPNVLGEEDEDRKVFAFGGWQPAFEFAVYGAVQCQAVGLDKADQDKEIRRVFEANVGKGVERALKATRFIADPDPDHTPDWWGAPLDVTVTGLTGSLSVLAALAALEGYAAEVYAGLPTIHMPRAAATILEAGGAIVWNGDKAFTKNGSKVAIGGGYDDHTALSAGDITMYATGEVYVERSGSVEINTLSAHAIATPGDGDAPIIPAGSSLSLAEEMFRVAVDCFTAKATASLS